MEQYSKLRNGKELIFLLFFCCSIFMSGCQSAEQHPTLSTIEVDIASNGELKLSEYFENFRMLKLPTDSVMGEIQKIQYENNKIYVSDGKTMFIFSDEGQLLSCFNKIGRGPGEYTGITDFVVNGETITILNRQRLLTYNQFGENISTLNLDFGVMSISQTVDNAYFLYCGNFANDKNQHILHKVRDGQENERCLPIDEHRAKYLFFFGFHTFYLHQDFVYFFDIFNDTVYVSSDKGIEPSFYIDYKGKNVPASFFERNYADIAVFMTEFHKTSYAYGVLDFVLCDRFLMFCSRYQQNRKLTIFDRKNKKSNTFATIKHDVYFNGLTIPVSDFKYQADKRIFIPLDAFDVFEWRKEHPPAEQFKGMVNATKEEDNPLLLIFDFKQ
jgi:hypothetical protein